MNNLGELLIKKCNFKMKLRSLNVKYRIPRGMNEKNIHRRKKIYINKWFRDKVKRLLILRNKELKPLYYVTKKVKRFVPLTKMIKYFYDIFLKRKKRKLKMKLIHLKIRFKMDFKHFLYFHLLNFENLEKRCFEKIRNISKVRYILLNMKRIFENSKSILNINEIILNKKKIKNKKLPRVLYKLKMLNESQKRIKDYKSHFRIKKIRVKGQKNYRFKQIKKLTKFFYGLRANWRVKARENFKNFFFKQYLNINFKNPTPLEIKVYTKKKLKDRQFIFDDKAWMGKIIDHNLQDRYSQKLYWRKKFKIFINNFKIISNMEKKKFYRYKLKIKFIEFLIPYFHRYNHFRLKKITNKKLSIYIKVFLASWKRMQSQVKFSLYYWYSFYISKIIDKGSNIIFLNKNKFLLVLVSYEKIILYIYFIVYYLKYLYQEFIIIKFLKKKRLKIPSYLKIVYKKEKKYGFRYRYVFERFKRLLLKKKFLKRKKVKLEKNFKKIEKKKRGVITKIKKYKQISSLILKSYIKNRQIVYIYSSVFFLVKRIIKIEEQKKNFLNSIDSNLFNFEYKLYLKKQYNLFSKQWMVSNQPQPYMAYNHKFIVRSHIWLIGNHPYMAPKNPINLKEKLNIDKYNSKKVFELYLSMFNFSLRLHTNYRTLFRGLRLRMYKRRIKYYLANKFKIRKSDVLVYLKAFYKWIFLFTRFNFLLQTATTRPYHVWIFYINYSLRYYIVYKLYLAYINYLFLIITKNFSKAFMILRLKKFELTYDLIKYKDSSRYKLGINPVLFIATFNRRVTYTKAKVEYIINDLSRLLNKCLNRNEIKGYYIRVKGRFKRGRRKSKLLRKNGTIAFNSLHLKLNSCYGILYTKFGVSGIKVIFAY